MANIGHIEIEVRPTVTLESAVACAAMLNLFFAGNKDYMLEVRDDATVHVVDTAEYERQQPDTVQVVRCRDCKHHSERRSYDNKTNVFLCVDYCCERDEHVTDVEPDGFCAWGERLDN